MGTSHITSQNSLGKSGSGDELYNAQLITPYASTSGHTTSYNQDLGTTASPHSWKTWSGMHLPRQSCCTTLAAVNGIAASRIGLLCQEASVALPARPPPPDLLNVSDEIDGHGLQEIETGAP